MQKYLFTYKLYLKHMHYIYRNNTTEMKKKLIEMSEDLFNKIQASAKENDRSVNKEITHLLKIGFKNYSK